MTGSSAHDELEHTIALPHTAGAAVMLVVVAMQLIPLVWAHTEGIRLLGAELDVSAAHRYTRATGIPDPA